MQDSQKYLNDRISLFQDIRKIIVITFILILSLLNCGSKEYCVIEIGGRTLKVEIADTEEKRAEGLMFRKKLATNEGMLFIFEKPDILHFWMKNTSIPLSIAFVNENFEIVQIEDMYPYDVVNIHKSKIPVKYAIEVNQGWFEKNNIKVGDILKIKSQ